MTTLHVVGFDPSLRNWGVALGTYHVPTGILNIHTLHLVHSVPSKTKQTRKNSEDIESAYQLADAAYRLSKGAQAVFVEVPVGSQSARAMASYGICVGVLGGLRAIGQSFFEVTPTEVKLAATGNKNASKDDMIHWAKQLYPDANWPASAAKAEHLADACAAIHAGIASNPFRQSVGLLQRLA